MKKGEGEVVRKRTLLDKTRHAVVLWVAGASAVVAAALVMVLMLGQTIWFNYNSVLKPMKTTISQLEKNKAAIPELKAEVRVLNTNPQLTAVGIRADSEPLRVILDALPADDNRLALGASLQQKLFNTQEVPGLSVDSLSVDPTSSGNVSATAVPQDGIEPLSFSASITGKPEVIRTALQRLERSIRAVNVQSVNSTSSGENVTLQISGVAYYLPSPSLDLTKKTVGSSSNAKNKKTQKGSK